MDQAFAFTTSEEFNWTLLFLIDALALGLVVWVYRSDPENIINRRFVSMSVALLFWVNGGYVFAYSDNPAFSLALGRLILGEVIWSFIFLYLFLLVFPTRTEVGRIVLYGIVIVGACLSLAVAFTPMVVERVQMTNWGLDPVYNTWGAVVYYLFVGALVAFLLHQIILRYMRLPGVARVKVAYVFCGFVIFLVANLFVNVVLPLLSGSIRHWQLGNYSVVILLGFTAYAIVKQELFGIRTVLTTLFVGAIGLLLAIDILGFTQDDVLQAFKGVFLILLVYFGYLLVQSVHREIAQREELERIAAELRRSDEAKTEFISIVSHQLRTPLNAIEGYLTLLLEGAYGKLDPQKRNPVERLYRSNERLIHLVNDLLSVSRIQMGRIELEIADVDLCSVARSLVEEFSMAAGEKGIQLSARCAEGGVPTVSGDVQKLRDSILNLVDNAIRYTNEGEVEVSVEREGEEVVVKVSDTGAGFEEADARALFESFQRGDVGRRRWTEGTGLGLYIAQQFVEMHEGRIWAESAGKGKGSTFFIRLPLQRREMAA